MKEQICETDRRLRAMLPLVYSLDPLGFLWSSAVLLLGVGEFIPRRCTTQSLGLLKDSPSSLITFEKGDGDREAEAEENSRWLCVPRHLVLTKTRALKGWTAATKASWVMGGCHIKLLCSTCWILAVWLIHGIPDSENRLRRFLDPALYCLI